MVHYKNQKYGKLKRAALKSGDLFKDEVFPAHHKSLFFSRVADEIEWKRPGVSCSFLT